ncbi:MAG: hypothetical protein ORN51_09170 [Akkermansiaceae bacterium]|nr:hypothetical protein [Akkermansiaceae bacterium]
MTKELGEPKRSRWRRKRRSESREARKHRKVVRSWSILLVFLGAVLITFFVYFWAIPQLEENEMVARLRTRNTDNARVVSKFIPPSEREAIQLVKDGLAVRDPKRIAELFRVSDSSPQEVAEALQQIESECGPIQGYAPLKRIEANGAVLGGVMVTYSNKENHPERVALLTPMEQGKWKIDFDAYMQSSKPAWDKIMTGGVDTAEVRVLVSVDTYFHNAFVNEYEWSCYRMVGPGRAEVLFGYCKAGSPEQTAVKQALFKQGGKVRMTLEIKKVEGASKRQFQITKAIAEDWVVANEVFDKKTK